MSIDTRKLAVKAVAVKKAKLFNVKMASDPFFNSKDLQYAGAGGALGGAAGLGVSLLKGKSLTKSLRNALLFGGLGAAGGFGAGKLVEGAGFERPDLLEWTGLTGNAHLPGTDGTPPPGAPDTDETPPPGTPGNTPATDGTPYSLQAPTDGTPPPATDGTPYSLQAPTPDTPTTPGTATPTGPIGTGYADPDYSLLEGTALPFTGLGTGVGWWVQERRRQSEMKKIFRENQEQGRQALNETVANNRKSLKSLFESSPKGREMLRQINEAVARATELGSTRAQIEANIKRVENAPRRDAWWRRILSPSPERQARRLEQDIAQRRSQFNSTVPKPQTPTPPADLAGKLKKIQADIRSLASPTLTIPGSTQKIHQLRREEADVQRQIEADLARQRSEAEPVSQQRRVAAEEKTRIRSEIKALESRLNSLRGEMFLPEDRAQMRRTTREIEGLTSRINQLRQSLDNSVNSWRIHNGRFIVGGEVVASQSQQQGTARRLLNFLTRRPSQTPGTISGPKGRELTDAQRNSLQKVYGADADANRWGYVDPKQRLQAEAAAPRRWRGAVGGGFAALAISLVLRGTSALENYVSDRE